LGSELDIGQIIRNKDQGTRGKKVAGYGLHVAGKKREAKKITQGARSMAKQ